MAYSTSDLVTDLIDPTGEFLDQLKTLTDAQIDAYIAKVDGKINDRLGGGFFPFNATTATPDTPDTIKEISRHWAMAESVRQLVGVNNQAAMDLADRHETIAMAHLQNVMTNGLAPETATDTLTFGTADSVAWTLAVDEAFLAATTPLDSGDPPNILPSTVRITGGTYSGSGLTDMRNDVEFRVNYQPGYQRWVFTALLTDLYQDVTGLQVTYEWNYVRIRGQESAVAPTLGGQFD